MEKFKQALIQFAHSNPNFSPNNIEQQFSQFFPDFRTPNHPPYAAMIHRAIWELNKKGGSSEESISKYIKKEYVDLPWAHSTLLKHHLDKLCDGKEICVNHKQRYSLAAVVDPVSRSTSEKKLKKRKREFESGKKDSGTTKKRKKMKSNIKPGKTSSKQQRRKRKKKEKRMVDIQETNRQMIDVGKEEDLDVQPLDAVADEREVDLEIEDQSEKVLSITDANDIVELRNEVEENLIQNNEVTGSEIRIEEENNDDEQVQMMQNSQLLQLEQSPDSSQFLKNGKRIYTRSQIKSILKKDESARSELVDPPSYIDMAKEKEHITEIIEGKEAKQTPSPVSTQMNGQRAKLRSSHKNTVVECTDTEQQKVISPSLETQLIKEDEPTQVQEAGSSEQDQQPEEPKDETQEDKPKKKGRKKSLQSVEKCKAGSRCSKRKRVENERLGKLKSKNKKDQLKNKRHKMTRRSTRKKRK